MTKCNYCGKDFDIQKVYPITYWYATKYPRYCCCYCKNKAATLRQQIKKGLPINSNNKPEDVVR